MVNLECAGLTALSSSAIKKRRQIHSIDASATKSGVKPPHSKLIKLNKLLVYPAAVGGKRACLWPSVLQHLHLVPIVGGGQNFNPRPVFCHAHRRIGDARIRP